LQSWRDTDAGWSTLTPHETEMKCYSGLGIAQMSI
jgi:hypothetical protein